MKHSLLIVFSFFTIKVYSQQADSVRLFLDSALSIMEKRSLFAENLDWKIIRDSAHKMAADARTYEGSFAALKFAFNLLQDKHGWLSLNDENYYNPFTKRDNSRINNETLTTIRKPMVRSSVIEKDYGYLSIPFFGGQTTEKMNAFAQRVQDSLCRVVNKKTKGLIIDLRLNGGGNLFPMIIGISNVLGNGRYTESVNSEGKSDGVFEMKNYTVTLLDTMIVKLQRSCGDFTKLPVAVLTGPATGSSGEQLAIILSTRKKTILIGERTAGYVTGNNGFLLPGKGNGVVIGESFTRDIHGTVYKEDVRPAISVTGGDHFDQLQEDKKVQAALLWFKTVK